MSDSSEEHTNDALAAVIREQIIEQFPQDVPRPRNIPSLHPAVADVLAPNFQERTQDLYRNTSLEEVPFQSILPISRSDSSDDDLSESTIEAESLDERQLAEEVEYRRDMERDTVAANAKGDELNLHYATEEAARQQVRVALQQLESKEPDLFAKFKKHIENAHVLTAAEVRIYDIIFWALPGLPDKFRKPFIDLQSYYHKETRLRFELAVLERRAAGGIDDWTEDHQYAANRAGQAPYGHETIYRANGIQDSLPRFADQSRLSLKHMLAGLEAREVRLQFAKMADRHGKKKWASDGCLDRKIVTWIEAAEAHLQRSFRIAADPVASGATQPSATTLQAPAAEMLTAPADVEAYVAFATALSQRKAQLKRRKLLVDNVANLRELHTEKLTAFEDAVAEASDGFGVSDEIKEMDAELKKLVAEVVTAEQLLTCEVGKGWDWLQNSEN